MNPFQKSGFVLLTICFVVNLYFQFFQFDPYVLIVEKYLSHDEFVSYPMILLFRINALFVLGYYVLWNSRREVLFNVNLREVVVLGFIVLLIILHFLRNQSAFINSLFVEDGLFENMTVIFSLAAVILLLLCLKHFDDRLSKLLLITISMGLFFLAGEEISWGQRIFGWTTSDDWNKLNLQKETNLHNMVIIPFLNNLFCLVMACILLFIKENQKMLQRILPVNSIEQLGFHSIHPWHITLLFLLGIIGNGELTEEVVSVFGLYFGIGIFRRLGDL